MNKNSTHIQSLIDFLLDTKPYHCKLTDIAEEYQFFENMNVQIDTKFIPKVRIKGTWAYPYFSNGSLEDVRVGEIDRCASNGFEYSKSDIKKFNASNHISEILLPNVVDKRGTKFENVANIVLADTRLLEGHDYFFSHGSSIFQITQTQGYQRVIGRFSDTFTNAINLDVVLPFIAEELIIIGPAVEKNANTITVNGSGFVSVIGVDYNYYEPKLKNSIQENSIQDAVIGAKAVSTMPKILAIMTQIESILNVFQNAQCSIELTTIIASLEDNILVTDYESLLSALTINNIPVISGYSGWVGQNDTIGNKYVSTELSKLTPSIIQDYFNDSDTLMSGKYEFNTVSDDYLTVTFDPNLDSDVYQEFEIHLVSSNQIKVIGSVTGLVGTYDTLNIENGFGRFNVSINSYVPGSKITVAPKNMFSIHKNAGTQKISLTKVHPFNYSRPSLYGSNIPYILSSTNVKQAITINDDAFASGLLKITAISSTQFSITHSNSDFQDICTINVPYAGAISFTVVSNSYQFVIGDYFLIQIINEVPNTEIFDLYFGYDVGGYDDDNLVYNNSDNLVEDYLKKIDLGYDSRFSSFDMQQLMLQLKDGIDDMTEYRLLAVPDLTKPFLSTEDYNLKSEDNVLSQNGFYDLASSLDSDGNVWSSPDEDSDVDIKIYYSSKFSVEKKINGVWVSQGQVSVNENFDNADLSFTIPTPQKPYIATICKSSTYVDENNIEENTVNGGDVFSIIVNNKFPYQTDYLFASKNIPFLNIHPHYWNFANEGTYIVKKTANGYEVLGQNNSQILMQENSSNRHFATNHIEFSIENYEKFNEGDYFTFNVYSEKPSILVYGSSKGYYPPAEVGKYYWNGDFGFKVKSPEIIFNNHGQTDTFDTDIGQITINVSPDAVSSNYTIKSGKEKYMLYRNNKYVSSGLVLKDEYLTIVTNGFSENKTVKFSIKADDIFDICNNVIILKPHYDLDDGLIIDKRLKSELYISIESTNTDLRYTNIDRRFIDHSTGHSWSLYENSPDASYINRFVVMDANALPFYDNNNVVTFTSASSNEEIGSITNNMFSWNQEFFNKYLLIGTPSTLIKHGTGSNTDVFVKIAEYTKFFIGSGSSITPIFTDSMVVNTDPNTLFKIKQNLFDTFGFSASDTQTQQFYAGYDNLKYDNETQFGYYDMGTALLDNFDKAKTLRAKNILTTEEQEELNLALSLISGHLINGDLDSTSITDFTSSINNFSNDFGIPESGIGLDIDEKPSTSFSTSFIESIDFTFTDVGAPIVNNPQISGMSGGTEFNIILFPSIYSDPPYDSFTCKWYDSNDILIGTDQTLGLNNNTVCYVVCDIVINGITYTRTSDPFSYEVPPV